MLRVIRPFTFTMPSGFCGTRELHFFPGQVLDADVAAHPWVRDHLADGAVEYTMDEPATVPDAVAFVPAEPEDEPPAVLEATCEPEHPRDSSEFPASEPAGGHPCSSDTGSREIADTAVPAISVADDVAPYILPAGFDWKRPAYGPVLADRANRLKRLRDNPGLLAPLRELYAADPARFICDWGITIDPRNADIGLPTTVPFLLFPRQVELVRWILARWQGRENGIVEKTREMGMSWLAVALSCTLCLFRPGVVVGIGSRKEELVDKLDDPKSLFWKARAFLSELPAEFLGSWDMSRHAPHMRIVFPDTDSYITGESGDQVGRGARTSLYFIDEAAFLERPLLVDAALSRTTNCRIDISTPNGMANSFAQRRHSGNTCVFTYHWRDDPRKDEAWYEAEKLKIDNPTVVAQELDVCYSGSVEGLVIPSAWVQAAIGAHVKLGLTPTGLRMGALDVADTGADKNAFAGRHGILLEHLESWSGAGSDIFRTVQRAFDICDEHRYPGFEFDSDGLGAGVRGDARVINERRKDQDRRSIKDTPFRGSAQVCNPDGEMVKTRKNKDYFANLKAQSWWSLRLRFQATYRAVVEKMPYDPDALISIDPKIPELGQLIVELSQPRYSVNGVGKIVIDKQPDGTRSPNLADAVMIAFNPASVYERVAVWRKLAV